MTLSEILHALSDEECFKMLQEVVEHKRLRLEDYTTRKRFYSRLNRLKDSSLIKKVGQNYRVTTLGRVLYDVLEIAQATCYLSWRLMAVDEIGGQIPQKERENIIRTLVTDEDVQKFVLRYWIGGVHELG